MFIEDLEKVWEDRNDFPDRIAAAGKGLFTLSICSENLP